MRLIRNTDFVSIPQTDGHDIYYRRIERQGKVALYFPQPQYIRAKHGNNLLQD